MAKLNYTKHEPIYLKSHPDFNEKWLQELIEEDPTILGLGDVVIVERERKQSSGGRIDFLLNDLMQGMAQTVCPLRQAQAKCVAKFLSIQP